MAFTHKDIKLFNNIKQLTKYYKKTSHLKKLCYNINVKFLIKSPNKYIAKGGEQE